MIELIKHISIVTGILKRINSKVEDNPSLRSLKHYIYMLMIVKWVKNVFVKLLDLSIVLEKRLENVIHNEQNKIARTISKMNVIIDTQLDIKQNVDNNRHNLNALMGYIKQSLTKKLDDVNTVQQIVKPLLEMKKIETHQTPIGNDSCRFPTVSNLSDIPSIIYYFAGNNKYPEGLYCRLTDEVVVEIPKVRVIADNVDTSRCFTMQCLYDIEKKCSSEKCTFIHDNQDYTKIGLIARCPNCPSYGNPSTLKTDVQRVKFSDIKRVLSYGLNDLISAVYYFDKNKKHHQYVISDVNKCTNHKPDVLSSVYNWNTI
jgi:hypothetical protein